MINYGIYQMNLLNPDKTPKNYFSNEILAYLKSEYLNTVIVNLSRKK